MMLIGGGVGAIRVVGWVCNLFSVTFKVSINDERYLQLFLDVLEFDSFLFLEKQSSVHAVYSRVVHVYLVCLEL